VKYVDNQREVAIRDKGKYVNVKEALSVVVESTLSFLGKHSVYKPKWPSCRAHTP
jgi:hypothetical protein